MRPSKAESHVLRQLKRRVSAVPQAAAAAIFGCCTAIFGCKTAIFGGSAAVVGGAGRGRGEGVDGLEELGGAYARSVPDIA
eukprot:1720248-Rhodomonas_salina.2